MTGSNILCYYPILLRWKKQIPILILYPSSNPLLGVYAAVTRKTGTGQTISPGEGIAPLEALKMYTHWSAYATFEENVKGSIIPGKLADLVVLSGDPTQVNQEEIKEIKVMMTIIDGKVVWER